MFTPSFILSSFSLLDFPLVRQNIQDNQLSYKGLSGCWFQRLQVMVDWPLGPGEGNHDGSAWWRKKGTMMEMQIGELLTYSGKQRDEGQPGIH